MPNAALICLKFDVTAYRTYRTQQPEDYSLPVAVPYAAHLTDRRRCHAWPMQPPTNAQRCDIKGRPGQDPDMARR